MKHLAIPVLALGILPLNPVSAAPIIATPERIGEIQAAIKAGNPHHAGVFAAMTERLGESNDSTAYPSGMGKYEDGYRAREAALAALLSTDSADREKYAEMAYESALKATESGSAPITGMHKNPNGLGLGAAMNGFNAALAYNWMEGTWSVDQKDRIRQKIEASLEDWPKFRHPNTTQGHDASNWVAVTRGAEFIMIHAIGSPAKYEGRLKTLGDHLVNHMKNAFGDLGAGQEGLGYTEYPGLFLLTAAIADRDLGTGAVWREVGNHSWWKLAMYAHSFQPRAHDTEDRKFLSWGVAERGQDQGWASLLIPTVPEDQLPHYLWFYDRHLGKDFAGPGGAFERHRAGAAWSLLLYPTRTAPSDPTGVFPAMVADSHGFAFFRNRWKDADDIQLMVGGDEVSHSNAWDQSDALGLSLLAQNNFFITGAGKSESEEAQTGILVNGKKYNKQRSNNGKMILAEPSPAGGMVGVDGGETYEKLGLSEAVRDVSVFFSPPGANFGIFSVRDRLKADGEKTFTWQLNTGSPQVSSNLELNEGEEQGRKTFTLTGRDGGYLKGWILHPADADILPGNDPFRIQVTAGEADIWIVLVTGKGKPEAARIVGDGLRSGIEIGSARTFLNPKTDQAVFRVAGATE